MGDLAVVGLATAVVLAIGVLLLRRVRRAADRAGRRVLLRARARVDRFKFARRSEVRAGLLHDPVIAEAVARHAAEHGVDEQQVWMTVRGYVDEIVPAFNVLVYYRFGLAVARFFLDLFYRVSVDHADRAALRALPRDAVVVYLMNHRSNADYVLVGYALSGQVAISYAVGEWARAFPLEPLFKAFGAYFIRRRFREPLYHTVLERYVQLITRNGVTQGIFPEGGLTRDGRLRPAKIGLLDYILGVAREPAFRPRMYLVPVGINYDRVLEDRSLLRELAVSEGAARTSRATQLREVVRYLWWNLGRLAVGRWSRYGRAAVTVGVPIPLAPWFARMEQESGDLFALSRPERLARVQVLCDSAMMRIGEIIPVTPVPLACAAIQSLEQDFVPRSRLLGRMMEMRDALLELNGRVIQAERDIAWTLELALRMLVMRRMVVLEGDGFAILPRNRPLVSYYANSVAHLLGPFEAGVRARDALPAITGFTGEWPVADHGRGVDRVPGGGTMEPSRRLDAPP